ncbi:MAG: YceI family protein, partial [Xanthomonadaceae bacterium]|nr:YceI family protein [Xanthomonadaceae bacterium]
MNKPLPIALGMAIILTGCAGTTVEPGHTRAWTDGSWPMLDSSCDRGMRYAIDREASQVLVRVDPDGPMARFGHSHVIGGPVIGGAVCFGRAEGPAWIDLSIDVAALQVDRPTWRRSHGLEPELAEQTIEGTRENLLGQRVLDVHNHPAIEIRAVGMTGPGWLPEIDVHLKIRDQVRKRRLAVVVDHNPGRLVARGMFRLDQSDFGLQPFST